MRRPVVFIALALTVGIAGQHMLKLNTCFLAALLFIEITGALLFNIKKKDKRLNYLFLIAAVTISGGIVMDIEESKVSQIALYEKEVIQGEGTINTAVKKDENYYKLVVNTDFISGTGVNEKTIINYYGDLEKEFVISDMVGRTIDFTGLVSIPDKKRNPNTFDYREYLKTVGIYTLIRCNSGNVIITKEISGKSKELLNYLSGIKGEISRNLILSIGVKRADLIAGMMWGEVDHISDNVMEQFRMNGTAHILSVSGIHVGLVYLYLNKLLLGRKNLYFDIVIIMLLICYSAMSAFSPSVVRAVTMITVHIISKHAFCRYDMLSCGAAALIFMLLLNPLSLFNVGFQLSFIAIFTLAGVVPSLQKIHDSFITPIMALQLGLSPVSAYIFNYFSLGSIIANIPIIFIASLIIPLGLFLIPLIILGFPLFLFHLTAVPMGYMVDMMLFVNDIVYSPGKSFFYVRSPETMLLVIYYFSLFFFTSEIFIVMFARKKYTQIKIIIVAIISLCVFINCLMFEPFSKAELIFVDVGQGDCLHVKTEKGRNILIDGGGNVNYDVGLKTLLPYLLKNGVKKIDAAFVTHLHQDHYGGIMTLARKGLVKKLYIYEGNLLDEARILEETGLVKKQIVYIGKGDRIRFDENVYIDVLSPQRKSSSEYMEMITDKTDENEKSLILKVNSKGISILMTGDIDREGEKRLVNQYLGTKILKSSILKISHHGSRNGTAEEFLEEVDPELAVIQVGKNNFGHPNPGIIETIQNKGIEIYRNDHNGAIGVSNKNSIHYDDKIKIITMYE